MIGRMTMKRLWRDQNGAILSAELVLLMTVLGIGAVAGIKTLGSAVVTELADVAGAVGSLDQSYSYSGTSFYDDCAWTAGSAYEDEQDVETHVEICTVDTAAEEEGDLEEAVEDDAASLQWHHRGHWRRHGEKWIWDRDREDHEEDDCDHCRNKDRDHDGDHDHDRFHKSRQGR